MGINKEKSKAVSKIDTQEINQQVSLCLVCDSFLSKPGLLYREASSLGGVSPHARRSRAIQQ